jgi:hypothetical protein
MIVYETTTALWHLKGAHERLKRADTLWPVMCKISFVGKDKPKIDKIGQKNDIETILDESKYLKSPPQPAWLRSFRAVREGSRRTFGHGFRLIHASETKL